MRNVLCVLPNTIGCHKCILHLVGFGADNEEISTCKKMQCRPQMNDKEQNSGKLPNISQSCFPPPHYSPCTFLTHFAGSVQRVVHKETPKINQFVWFLPHKVDGVFYLATTVYPLPPHNFPCGFNEYCKSSQTSPSTASQVLYPEALQQNPTGSEFRSINPPPYIKSPPCFSFEWGFKALRGGFI